MFHSFLSIAPLHQLPNKNILQRGEDGGVQGEGGGRWWKEGGGSLRECGRQPPCTAFQAFVMPGNLFPVNVLSQ